MAGEIGSLMQSTRGFLADSLGRFSEVAQKREQERSDPVRLGTYIGGQLDPMGRLGQIRTGLPGGTMWGTGAMGTIPSLDYLNQHGTPFRNPYAAPAGDSGFAMPKPGGGEGPFNPQAGPGGNATYTGLPQAVGQWANQVEATFGDLGGWVPAAMLAIIQHESDGNPDAYNGAAAGGAWGLFQQIGIGNHGANAQFQAAHQLAQEKLRGIEASYQANGLNPDERTRARDLFLAWAGHFDYGTGQPNPGSRDVGNGEDADGFLNGPRGIMPMYDNVVRGRQQAAAQGGNVPISPENYAFPVVGYQGEVQLHWGSEHGGSDIMAPAGTPIVAMRGGKVIDAGSNSLGGNTVTILGDDGLTYYYAHMQGPALVQAGQTIKSGTSLGAVGNTGNAANTPAHLHLGIGYGIVNGGGPTGGLGQGYDAYNLLSQVLSWTRRSGGGQQSY